MRMPSTSSRSVTTTEPICRSSIRAVASAKEMSAEQVTAGADIRSWTVVAMVAMGELLLRPRIGPVRALTGFLQCGQRSRVCKY